MARPTKDNSRIVLVQNVADDGTATGGSGGGGDASAANQATGNASLASIDSKLTTIDGRVDGLETLIGATNTLVTAGNSSLSTMASDTTPAPTYPFPVTPVSGLVSTAMTSTTSTAVTGVGAGGSGKFNYITQVTVSNFDADTNTDIELQDGSGGTTFYIIPAPFASGAAVAFPTPLKQPTANTALYVKNSVTGASTRVSVTGFQA